MARNYGQIISAIWDDTDFRALPGEAQRVYLMLVTQSDISSAGVLSMTIRRWSGYAIDSDTHSLSDSLSLLQERRFVVLDEETEEVLVRTFVKWDGGAGNPKRRPAIIRAAEAIRSLILRQVLAQEMDKLGIPHNLSGRLSTGLSDSHTDTQSDRHADTPGFLVTVGDIGEPEPTTLKPEPIPPSAARSELATVEPIDTTQAIIAEWQRRVRKRPPERVIGQTAKLVREMLAQGIDPDDIRRGVAAWSDKGLHPSTLPAVVHEVQNAAPVRTRDQQAADDLFDAAARRMGVLA